MPDGKLSREEGFERAKQFTLAAVGYPVGTPFPVAVTLTDEQWAAVAFAVGVTHTHCVTEGVPSAIPEHIVDNLESALKTISTTLTQATEATFCRRIPTDDDNYNT